MEKIQRFSIFTLMTVSFIAYVFFDKPIDAIYLLGLAIYNYMDFYNRYK